MGKFTLKSVLSFLGHHATDLHSVANVLEGVVGALPINAETRNNINKSIERVRNSADNITGSLENLGVLTHAEPIDQEAVIRKMVAEYMAAHPNSTAPAAQVAADMRTANTGAHDEPTRTTAISTTTTNALQEGRDATPGALDKVAGRASGTANAAPEGAPVNKEVPAADNKPAKIGK